MAINAVEGEVGLAPDEPLRERKAARGIEHLLIRLEPSEIEKPHDLVPKPFRLGDRPSPERLEIWNPDLGHEPPQVRPRDVRGMPNRAIL